MIKDDIDRYFDLDRMLKETITRESDSIEEVLFGESIDEEPEPVLTPEPRRRGRPPGVKESAPRKRKPNIILMIEHLESAMNRLELL